MSSQAQRAAAFLALHESERPLLLPNPWDAGSATLLAAAGFKALATTSSGFAATLARLDGSVTRDEALTHARAMRPSRTHARSLVPSSCRSPRTSRTASR